MRLSPVLLALGALLCAGAASAGGPPTINSVQPDSVVAGGAEFVIKVTGSQLDKAIQVRWNGTVLDSWSISQERRSALVPAAYVAVGGTASITLVDAAGASSAITFTIQNPAPQANRIKPTTLVAGTLTVLGKNFIPSSVILVNGAQQATTFVSTTMLKADITDSAIGTNPSATVSVLSPGPGGGMSNVLEVAVMPNLLPVLTGVSPASFALWQNGATLTVTGVDFVHGSTVYWGAERLVTTYVSASTLNAQVPASLLVGPNSSTTSITVFNPGPGGGTSGALSVSMVNPVPVLSTVWPQEFSVYQSGTSLTLTGSGFVPGATVYWSGTALTTQYISQYSVTATAPTSLFAAIPSGAPVVTVGNPTPGGGMSNALAVTESCYVPLTPFDSIDLTDGAADQSVQLLYDGTLPASLSVLWNGSPLTVQSVSLSAYNTTITTLVPAADLEAGGVAEITVVDGCGSSAPIEVNIAIPTPTITASSPDAAFGIVGGSGITVTLTGSDFLPGVTVSLDGSPRATTYVSGTEVQVALTSSDVAMVGGHALTAINTGIGAAKSGAYFYTVGYSVNALSQEAFDIAWDPTNQVLYASSGYWTANPDTMLTIDPTTGNVTNTVSTPSPPDTLAISDDDSYLYVGLGFADEDTAVLPTIKRYSLPGLVPDISWTVGAENNYAQAIAVAPGAPHTVAVIRNGTGDVLIYDDGVARTDTVARLFLNSSISFYGDLAWTPDATTLYSGDTVYSYSLFKFDVDSSGVTFDTKYVGILPQGSSYEVHYDALTGYVFTDGGVVINPASGTVVANLTLPGTNQRAEGVALDDVAGLVYVAYPGGSPTYGEISIVAYDLTTLTVLSTAEVFTEYPTANPITHITRWGTHGLALVAGFGSIFILQGDFVK